MHYNFFAKEGGKNLEEENLIILTVNSEAFCQITLDGVGVFARESVIKAAVYGEYKFIIFVIFHHRGH